MEGVKLLKIVCISDTHTLHRSITIPKCDLLIHAGDFSSLGRSWEVEDFLSWFSLQPAQEKVYIAGNHDLSYEEEPWFVEQMVRQWSDIHYLKDSEVKIDGLKIYGSPYQVEFMDWAFNLPREGKELKAKWDAIPDDTDILITHCPPHNILDTTPYENYGVGDELLLERVKQVKPKLHVFGHLHLNHETYKTLDTLFINASICTERYEPINKPILIEIVRDNTWVLDK
jgi:Icc-related predicted phosphoesterase